jgi:threonine dehydrogenase-like Zn-dependent dehydrogenase
MKAIQFLAPRKIHLLDDVPPPEPQDGEVLVRCTHLGICGSNVGPYTGDGYWGERDWPSPIGWTGHENVGTIVASRDAAWPVGTTVLSQSKDYNGFVEYMLPKPSTLARLPSGADDVGMFVLAQPLATVLRALNRTRPPIGHRCAVVGQGPIGLMFTHMISRMGASQVIGIDLVPWRLKWSRRLGASDIVDASQENVVEAVRELTGGATIDYCVEAANTPDALSTAALLLRRQGRLCVFGVPHHNFQSFPWRHATANEAEIITSRGGNWADYQPTAIDLVAHDADLQALVTPWLPWEQAAQAFEMYAYPAQHEGSLKVVLGM